MWLKTNINFLSVAKKLSWKICLEFMTAVAIYCIRIELLDREVRPFNREMLKTGFRSPKQKKGNQTIQASVFWVEKRTRSNNLTHVCAYQSRFYKLESVVYAQDPFTNSPVNYTLPSLWEVHFELLRNTRCPDFFLHVVSPISGVFFREIDSLSCAARSFCVKSISRRVFLTVEK